MNLYLLSSLQSSNWHLTGKSLKSNTSSDRSVSSSHKVFHLYFISVAVVVVILPVGRSASATWSMPSCRAIPVCATIWHQNSGPNAKSRWASCHLLQSQDRTLKNLLLRWKKNFREPKHGWETLGCLLKVDRADGNQTRARNLVSKGGRYVVALWSVCGGSVCGRYVAGMWSVCGRYGVGMWLICGRYVVGMWMVCGRTVVDINYLLTEREICTEKTSPEVLTVQTEPLRRGLYGQDRGRYFRIFSKRGASWELISQCWFARTDGNCILCLIDEWMKFPSKAKCSRSKSELQASASRCDSNGWPRQSRSLHHFRLSLFADCAVEFTGPDLEIWNLQAGTLPIFAPASTPRTRRRRKEFYYPEGNSENVFVLFSTTKPIYEGLAQRVVRLGWR